MTIDLKALREWYSVNQDARLEDPGVVALIDWVERVKPIIEVYLAQSAFLNERNAGEIYCEFDSIAKKLLAEVKK